MEEDACNVTRPRKERKKGKGRRSKKEQGHFFRHSFTLFLSSSRVRSLKQISPYFPGYLPNMLLSTVG